MPDSWQSFASPVGTLLLAGHAGRLCAVRWLPQGEPARQAADRVFPGARHRPDPVLAQAALQLDDYFLGGLSDFTIPLDLLALTPFVRHILTSLRAVPFGSSVSYAELARRAGLPRTAARAVGRAMAINPLPIIIPCHRVIAADGSLGGYSGGAGLPTKRQLLAFEARHSRSVCVDDPVDMLLKNA